MKINRKFKGKQSTEIKYRVSAVPQTNPNSEDLYNGASKRVAILKALIAEEEGYTQIYIRKFKTITTLMELEKKERQNDWPGNGG